jgi:hypothetical protein
MLEMRLWSMDAVLPTLNEAAGKGKPGAPRVSHLVDPLVAINRRCRENSAPLATCPPTFDPSFQFQKIRVRKEAIHQLPYFFGHGFISGH